ncbi:MAG TPA: precorrin-3B synthase [Actinoplanes sp.]|nr:precorrin-3B synthase [Actinoplanes sp.]
MALRRTSETDACPGALRLHAAADGMLARVRLPGGRLTGAQLRSLRSMAAEFGDGALELTSRANLQLRGLAPSDATALADRLRSAGLLPSTTHDNVRNIAAPPLPDRWSRALVDELDRAILADPALPALPGKFLFAIGHVPLAADVAAIPAAPTGTSTSTDSATPTPGDTPAVSGGVPFGESGGQVVGSEFTVRFAGHDTGIRVAAGQVVPVLIAAAHAFLAERSAQRGDGAAAWRLRELTDGPARVSGRVVAALGLVPVPVEVAVPVAAAEPGDLIGIVPQDDGLVAVAGLVPLGRLTGVQLKVLEEADHLVVTPWRGVLVSDLPPETAQTWADRLAGAGLAVTPGSAWSGVTSCAGQPGCARSLADVRADAVAAARFVDGLPVHWAGCARACGSPAGPHVLAEATTGGYLVTRRLTAGGPAVPVTAADDGRGPGAESGPGAGNGLGTGNGPGTGGGPGRGGGPGGESGLVGPSTPAVGSLRIGGAGSVTGDPGSSGLGDVVAVARRL